MAVKYVSFDGEQVSVQWYALLRAIRYEDHVAFNVREGHRTMARQWYFYNLWRSGRGNLAAFPSPWAPHIRTGRFDHAIDFGNAYGVYLAAAHRGVYLKWTVRGESWHLEADAKQLENYYLHHHVHIQRVLRFGNRGNDVKKVQVMLRALDFLKSKRVGKNFGPKTRTAVKRFQKAHHLKADGVVGPITRKTLNRAYDRKVK